LCDTCARDLLDRREADHLAASETGGTDMKMRRALAAVSVVAAAAVTPVVTATAAHAARSTCVNYLGNLGLYQIGPKVKEACSHPAYNGPLGDGKVPNPACYNPLTDIGVRGIHAYRACVRA
jgi:hypothetical protein